MGELLESFQAFGESYAITIAIAFVCAYLGLFTVLRRIVFTGVALAQLAAAGVAGASWVAEHPDRFGEASDLARRFGAVIGGLGLALAGVVALEVRGERRKVSADALVGLAYAVSAALAILFVHESAHGLAELKNILAGEVLLIREADRNALGIGLVLVVLVQVIWRREFLLVSYDPEFARAQGLPERRYQLLLMGSLAVAVALSLKVAGLILVFALLVLPPVAGLILGRKLHESTWLALAAAAAASLLGFIVAILANLPVAPTIATCLLGLVLLAWLGSLQPLVGAAVRALFAGTAVLALVAVVVGLSGRPPSGDQDSPTPVVAADHHGHEHDHSDRPDADSRTVDDWIRILQDDPDPESRVEAAKHLEDLADAKALVPLVEALTDSESLGVRKASRKAIVCLGAQEGVRERLRAALDDEEGELRIPAGLALAFLGELRGVRALIAGLADDLASAWDKTIAFRFLKTLNQNRSLGYEPEPPAGDDDAAFAAWEAKNAQASQAWKVWWNETGSRMHWDAKRQRFRPHR